jgi:hypothetical protein
MGWVGLMKMGDILSFEGHDYTVSAIHPATLGESAKISVDAVRPLGKPYYNNAPGERPQAGDVFRAQNGAITLINGWASVLKWTCHNGQTANLDTKGFIHTPGYDEGIGRTLLVRDGKPWT